MKGSSLSQQPSRPRTIFHRALEASKLTWGDKHLQLILKNDLDIDLADRESDLFDCRGIPLWHGKDLRCTPNTGEPSRNVESDTTYSHS